MPKLKPETQALRRDHILDMAERCFALSGFHRTTVHDICRQAGVSPGALYVHFDSKEALIEGLCDRDRAEFTERFRVLAAAPDFLSALHAVGTDIFIEEPAHKRLFAAEMAVESTRNPRIAQMYRTVDAFVFTSFEALFTRLKAEGRIAPVSDIPEVARVFQLIGDGLLLRRAVHPDFDFASVHKTVLQVAENLLNPTPPLASDARSFRPTDPVTSAPRLAKSDIVDAAVANPSPVRKPAEVMT